MVLAGAVFAANDLFMVLASEVCLEPNVVSLGCHLLHILVVAGLSTGVLETEDGSLTTLSFDTCTTPLRKNLGETAVLWVFWLLKLK